MARTIPPERLAAVIDAAVRVFAAYGYQRSQIQDVADALGLAKGTVYGYAASKEALFAASIRYGDGLEPLPELSQLPLPTPRAGEVVAFIADRLAAEVPDLLLTKALEPESLPRTAAQAEAELAAIVVDLYDRLSRNRVAIKLVDRCAPELPDLGAVWSDTGRGAQMSGMAVYLDSRQSAGLLSLPGPVDLVARTIVELCVLWAVHCRFDPDPSAAGPLLDDAIVASTLAAMVVRSMTSPGGS